MMLGVAVATAAGIAACGGSEATETKGDAQIDAHDSGVDAIDTGFDSGFDSGFDTADVVPVPIYGSPPPSPK